MTGKDILDKCDKIIKRQDLDRDLLLFFINSMRREIFRDKYIYKFNQYIKNVNCVDGIIDLPTLKNPRVVEYELTDDTNVTTTTRLTKVLTYEKVLRLISSIEALGKPSYFYLNGTKIQILPVPTEGNINIYGEFWLPDLLDSNTSTDITTIEMPDILVYLGCAEYFDMLDETKTGSFWRQKGIALLDQYMKQIRRQETDGVDLLKRDPFGNLSGTTYGGSYDYEGTKMDEVDGGTF